MLIWPELLSVILWGFIHHFLFLWCISCHGDDRRYHTCFHYHVILRFGLPEVFTIGCVSKVNSPLTTISSLFSVLVYLLYCTTLTQMEQHNAGRHIHTCQYMNKATDITSTDTLAMPCRCGCDYFLVQSSSITTSTTVTHLYGDSVSHPIGTTVPY